MLSKAMYAVVELVRFASVNGWEGALAAQAASPPAAVDGFRCTPPKPTPELGWKHNGPGCDGSTKDDTFCFKHTWLELRAQKGGELYGYYWFVCHGRSCRWNFGNRLPRPGKKFNIAGATPELYEQVNTGAHSVDVQMCALQRPVP